MGGFERVGSGGWVGLKGWGLIGGWVGLKGWVGGFERVGGWV